MATPAKNSATPTRLSAGTTALTDWICSDQISVISRSNGERRCWLAGTRFRSWKRARTRRRRWTAASSTTSTARHRLNPPTRRATSRVCTASITVLRQWICRLRFGWPRGYTRWTVSKSLTFLGILAKSMRPTEFEMSLGRSMTESCSNFDPHSRVPATTSVKRWPKNTWDTSALNGTRWMWLSESSLPSSLWRGRPRKGKGFLYISPRGFSIVIRAPSILRVKIWLDGQATRPLVIGIRCNGWLVFYCRCCSYLNLRHNAAQHGSSWTEHRQEDVV